jgi:PAS domain S-box-containing protein
MDGEPLVRLSRILLEGRKTNPNRESPFSSETATEHRPGIDRGVFPGSRNSERMNASSDRSEEARASALHAYGILDTPAEEAFDGLVMLATQVCATPMALLGFIDPGRVWIKAKVGLDASELPRSGFCARAIEQEGPLIIADAAMEPDLASDPFLNGQVKARFCAAVPLRNRQGDTIGLLMVFDRVPRRLRQDQEQGLQALGHQAMALLDARCELSKRARTVHAPGDPKPASHSPRGTLPEGRFRKAFDASPELMVISALSDGRYIEVNETFLRVTGYRREEVIGRTASEVNFLIDPWERSRIRQLLRQRGGAHNMEARFRLKSGEERVGLLSATTIHLGYERYVLYVVNDITERERAEEEQKRADARMQRAQKLESLGILAGGIGHDFNNLLMGILGNASLALEQLPEDAPARYHIREIEKSALRAADLTAQMLAYAGEGETAREPVNLSKLAEEMGDLLHSAVSKKATLRCTYAANLPVVLADPAQMRQVLMNLVTNASEALGADEGGIRVSTGILRADRAYLSHAYPDPDLPAGSYVYLEVSDTGMGMDAKTRARIFEPFYSTKGPGRGLGLAACLGIARGHGGGVLVDSRPGHGTTIRLLLPCAKEQPPVEPSARPSPMQAVVPAGAPRPAALSPEVAGKIADTWRGSGTVLVVDDEEVVRAVARMMLEFVGYTVLVASDGVEGVEVFRQHADEIAVVLLDMSMPRMNGEQAFDAIRAIRPDARVILSSGYQERETIERFSGKGLAAFLPKPYQFQALLRKIREVTQC